MAHRLYPLRLLRRAHRDAAAKAQETTDADAGNPFLSLLDGDQPASPTAIVIAPTTTTTTTSDIFGFPIGLPTGLTDLFPPTTESSLSSSSSAPLSVSSTSLSTSSVPSVSSISSTPSITPSSSSTAQPSRSTQTIFSTAAAASAAPSVSASAAPSGGAHTGTIVGAVGASIIGVALLIACVGFLLRRFRKSRDDAAMFDAASFRRSALLMPDPPTHNDTVAAGFNPRPPPSIMEQVPGGLPSLYGARNVNYPDHVPQSPVYGLYDNGNMPMSANSANPFMNPAPYQDSPFSPVSPSRTVPAGPLPWTSTPSVGTSPSRQSSFKSPAQASSEAQYASYPSVANDASRQSMAMPTSDYIDLNRSSVTPFQAAQYVEISKTLNTTAPSGLPAATCDQIIEGMKSDGAAEDDEVAPAVPEKDNVHRVSAASDVSVRVEEFPAPPSPALSSSSRSRIDSMPPMLPEINIQSRNSFASGGYDFPASVRGSSVGTPLTAGFGAQTILVDKPTNNFPVTPSPLATSFVMNESNGTGSEDRAPTARPASVEQVKRPETVYDPEDAYGGF